MRILPHRAIGGVAIYARDPRHLEEAVCRLTQRHPEALIYPGRAIVRINGVIWYGRIAGGIRS